MIFCVTQYCVRIRVSCVTCHMTLFTLLARHHHATDAWTGKEEGVNNELTGSDLTSESILTLPSVSSLPCSHLPSLNLPLQPQMTNSNQFSHYTINLA